MKSRDVRVTGLEENMSEMRDFLIYYFHRKGRLAFDPYAREDMNDYYNALSASDRDSD